MTRGIDDAGSHCTDMKSSELHKWRKRQNFSSWKAAADALSLPYSRMLRFKNGEEEIPLRIELECINLEWSKFAGMIGDRAVSYLEVLRYTWFSERIIKAIELPRDDSRRKELSINLLLGLIAIIADDFDTSASTVLKRVQSRIGVPQERRTQSGSTHVGDHHPPNAGLDVGGTQSPFTRRMFSE